MSAKQLIHTPVTVNHLCENAVFIQWPESIDEEQHQHIMYCQRILQHILADVMIDTIASYATLLIYYRFDLLPISINEDKGSDSTKAIIRHSGDIETLVQKVVNQPFSISSSHSSKTSASQVIEIPVYYGEEAGWDINHVSQATGLTIPEVISQHTEQTYRAFALGFTPGFCYLGQLTSSLQLPRKETPRVAVPKGAVAIAERQTAVYPNNSPGGWHILGQTPINMTNINTNINTNIHQDSEAEQQICHSTSHCAFRSTINVGDTVKFTAITKEKFLSLGGTIQLAQREKVVSSRR